MPRPKAPAGAARKPRVPKPAAGHQLAAKIPAGEVLKDYCKGEWKLGKPIGCGGFGLIYLADRNSAGAVSDSAPYVMKVEPHSNGPLFCELHFYQRVGKPDMITQWKQSKKLKSLGVPEYIASGSHDNGKVKNRFMVMERCGTDLQKIFESNGKGFLEKTVYLLGIKLLNALEYIHDNEYVHADIKASNLLTGFGRGKTDEVYLVDYGLAYRYSADGKHKEYKEDPKRVHDGTIEFTSRDAHKGVAPSRRGDLEILGYCMLQWLCHNGQLPWENNLLNKEYVRDQKIKHMRNISGLMSTCLRPGSKQDELAKFLQYVVGLDYPERPDYNKCRQLFRQGLKRFGGSESDKPILTGKAGASAAPKVTKKRKSVDDDDDVLPPSKYRFSDTDSDDAESPAARRRATRTPVSRATPRGSSSATPRGASSATPRGASSATPRGASSATPRGASSPTPRGTSSATPRGTSAKSKRPINYPFSDTDSDGPRSPASRPRAKAGRITPRAKSPAKAKKRLGTNGEIIPMPAVPPQHLANGQSGSEGLGSKKKGGATAARQRRPKPKVVLVDTAMQTSPGLQGLARSRKKRQN